MKCSIRTWHLSTTVFSRACCSYDVSSLCFSLYHEKGLPVWNTKERGTDSKYQSQRGTRTATHQHRTSLVKEGRKENERKAWLAQGDKEIKKYPQENQALKTTGGKIKYLYFKVCFTWLETNSFVEGIEGVPLFSNLHLSEQLPEDSAQTSTLREKV